MEGNEYYRHGKRDYLYEDDIVQMERITREDAEIIYWYKRAEQIFEKNSLEKTVLKKSKIKRKRSVSDSRYIAFYQEASRLSSDIGKGSDGKRRLLAKYFPGRFGDEGRQPVCEMDYLNLGSLFNKMVKYSEQRIKQ